jgi:hypothetical protein
MYFGLTNSPATFQTMMNEIFQDLITEGVVSIYLDDILIFTDSLEDHRQITCLVLDCMHEHKLYLRPEKCEFEKTKIEYLPQVSPDRLRVWLDPTLSFQAQARPGMSLYDSSSITSHICIYMDNQ